MTVTVSTMLVYLTAVAWAVDPPLVTVDSVVITSNDVELLRSQRGLPADLSSTQRADLVEQLIDRQLMRQFLKSRKIAVDEELLAQQVQEIEERIRKSGQDPEALLPKLGFGPEQLRDQARLSLAWEQHVLQTVTDDQMKAYFDEHRPELDGTRVRIRQIFRAAKSDAEATKTIALLEDIQQKIATNRIKFAAAAAEYSQAPSKDQGGDIGWVGARGRVPDVVYLAALKVRVGDVADPIRSEYGVHLIQVTERQPGQLSREDARPQILVALRDQLWRTTADQLRKTAKIVRSNSVR